MKFVNMRSTTGSCLILSALFVLVSAVTVNMAYELYEDGTHSYAFVKDGAHPSANDLDGYAKAGYDDVEREAKVWDASMSNVVAALWVPGKGVIVHGNIVRKGEVPVKTADFINSCSINGHRYDGSCAEVAAIAEALAKGWPLKDAVFSAYGYDKNAGGARKLHPCSAKDGKDGCAEIIKAVEARCISKRGGTKGCARVPTPKLPKKVKAKAPAKKTDVPKKHKRSAKFLESFED